MIVINEPGVFPVPVLPWDGQWNLDDDSEMLAMLKMLSRQHTPALFMANGEWQMGWKGKKEIWGMRLPCPRRAIRDATERLFRSIKGKEVANGDYPPNPRLKGVYPVEVLALAARHFLEAEGEDES